MKDKDIQHLLEQKGIHLSVRTICNCRKLLNIPSYKERIPNSHYYGKEITFSDYVMLSKDKFSRIPHEAGVYELSISSKIAYPNHRNNVIYIGTSKDMRRRIATYTGSKLKNNCLKKFIKNNDVFVRFYLTKSHIRVEKNLLKNFKKVYGELPKANSLGG